MGLQEPVKHANFNTYLAYGLLLSSDRRISGLTPIEFPEPDSLEISVHFCARDSENSSGNGEALALWYTSDIRDEQGNPALTIWKGEPDGDFCIRYSHGLEFWVDREASSISVCCSNDAAENDAAEFLLGPVLGIVLRLRGLTCLHASAVSVGEEAIAFVGREGSGKSTTAALFVQEGHAALTDDIVSLREAGSSFAVCPGYPCINLWPDSLQVLNGNFVRKHGDDISTKQSWVLGGKDRRFHNEALPLGAIYILDERQVGSGVPRVAAIGRQEALVKLIANTYANKLPDVEMRRREFGFLGRLVNKVPVRRVIRHEDLGHLRELYQIILQDFTAPRNRAAAAAAAIP